MTKKYKIGFTAGTFDILNIGHIAILRKAKALCSYLIVAVNSDELILKHKGVKPIVPLEERAKLIGELRCVDKVVVQYNLVDINQFKKLKADIFFVGSDYKNRNDISGIKWFKENNKIKFFPYTKDVSSSIIKERIINNSEAIKKAQKSRNKNAK
jgi:glycerol-3-phosphate cytidylyltransferase